MVSGVRYSNRIRILAAQIIPRADFVRWLHPPRISVNSWLFSAVAFFLLAALKSKERCLPLHVLQDLLLVRIKIHTGGIDVPNW